MPITISTASIIKGKDETSGTAIFGPRNINYGNTTQNKWGSTGGKIDQPWIAVNYKFSNMSPVIPKGAKIVSAVVRGTAADNESGAFFTVIRVFDKDGFWDVVKTPDVWRKVGETAPAFGSSAQRTDINVHVLTTGLATMVDTDVSAPPLFQSGDWQLRDNASGRFKKIGQSVDIVTGGTLGFVDIGMSRNGSPPNDVWAEIYSQDANGLGDVLLATSDTRPAVGLSGTSNQDTRFTFSGADQITLTAGQKIVVSVTSDYPTGTPNVEVFWASNNQYAPGSMVVFGEGIGYDDNNYPMQIDYEDGIPYVAFPDFAVWIAPPFTAFQEKSTIDFSALIQNYHNTTYTDGDPYGVQLTRNLFLLDPGDVRGFLSFNHADTPETRLIVGWKPRRIRVY